MRRVLLPLAGASLLLGACSDDMSDLQRDVAAIKARTSTKIPPIPQPKQFESFTYVPDGRRDPFVALIEPSRQASATGPRPDMNRNREPLEEFPLDALRMMGTISTPKGVFALIKAPDNVIHRVALKNYMGQNYGQIVSITPTEVTLRELIEDGFGGWTQRTASVALTE